MEDLTKYNADGTMLRKAQERLIEMLIEIDRICKKHNITYWIDGGTALGAVRHKGFIPWDDDIDIAVLRKDYNKLLKILQKELPDRFVLQNKKTEKYYHLMYSRVVDKNSLSDYGENRVKTRKKMKNQGLFIDLVFIEKGNLKLKKIVDHYYIGSFHNLTFYNNFKKKILAQVSWPIFSLLVLIIRCIYSLIPSDKYIFGYGIPFMRDLRRSEILPVKPIEFENIIVSAPNNVHAYLKRYFGNYMQIPPVEQRKTHAEKIEVYDIK